jgi:3-oxoacyl-[acyl-carrier-protein] synthase-3
MLFEKVRIESLAHVVPERVVRSDEIEARLAPIYARLKLASGRIELMSGIRERRFFEPGTRPSAAAARAGELALARSGVARDRIGCLIHASVCRDFLEPSTASVVHHRLELGERCSAFDLSNACLGFANAMTVIGAMIERGEIEAGLVVAAEDGGPLVEATIRALCEDERAARRELKRAHASLTIGSGAAACVLAVDSIASSRKRLLGGVALADTRHHVLCQGDKADGFDGPLMETDSESLMQAGNALAARTWERFLAELGWRASDVDRIVTHQVGVAHRKLLLSTLGLDFERDFPTVETLGNIGSVSLPLSLSLALERGFVRDGDQVAMLGIGSGLHCLMLGVQC